MVHTSSSTSSRIYIREGNLSTTCHDPEALQMAMRCIARTCLEKLERGDHNAAPMAQFLVEAAEKHERFAAIVPKNMPATIDLNAFDAFARVNNANANANARHTYRRRSRSRSRSRGRGWGG